jgi:hypothetical protein
VRKRFEIRYLFALGVPKRGCYWDLERHLEAVWSINGNRSLEFVRAQADAASWRGDSSNDLIGTLVGSVAGRIIACFDTFVQDCFWPLIVVRVERHNGRRRGRCRLQAFGQEDHWRSQWHSAPGAQV